MPIQEGFGGLGDLGGLSLDEAAVAVGQVEDEAMGLPLHAADDHQSRRSRTGRGPGGWDSGTNISRVRRRCSRA